MRVCLHQCVRSYMSGGVCEKKKSLHGAHVLCVLCGCSWIRCSIMTTNHKQIKPCSLEAIFLPHTHSIKPSSFISILIVLMHVQLGMNRQRRNMCTQTCIEHVSAAAFTYWSHFPKYGLWEIDGRGLHRRRIIAVAGSAVVCRPLSPWPADIDSLQAWLKRWTHSNVCMTHTLTHLMQGGEGESELTNTDTC